MSGQKSVLEGEEDYFSIFYESRDNQYQCILCVH